MEANVSKYTNAIGSGKQAITQRQKRKGGRGMREGWEYKKLGEVASSELGKTLNKSKDTGKLYPYICAVNVLWDMIDLTILKHAFFEKEEIDRYSVRKGDLLVCEGGDTGRSAIWEKEEPVLYQNALHRVRFTTEMEARFAMYCLWHLKNNGQIDQKYSKGVTIKHLVKSSLLSIELPVPPLSTQRSIVSELDKINELIRLKKEQLKDYDNLAQSIFYEMFGDPVVNEKGWGIKKLGNFCEIGTGSTPSRKNKEYYEGSISWVKSTEVSNCVIDSTEEHISEIAIAETNCTIYPKGTILIAMYGQGKTRGQIAILNIEATTNQAVAAILPSELCDKLFLYHCLHLMYENIRSMARGGNQANLNLAIVRSINIILPPLPLQQAFAQRIELIKKQKAEIKSAIADLETLLASRMQYWFD